MHINGARVALGAVIGAGIAAAAAAGLDALVDDKLVEQGVDQTLNAALDSKELVDLGVVKYTPPTALEKLWDIASEKLGDLAQGIGFNGNVITVETLNGTVDISNVDGLKDLIAQGQLSSDVNTQLTQIVEAFEKQAEQAGAVAAGPAGTQVDLADALSRKDSILGTTLEDIKNNKLPWWNGFTANSASTMDGFTTFPHPSGGEVHIDGDKFVEHFDTLTKGMNGKELEAMEALKAHLTPALDLQTIGIGAGAGGFAGAASSAFEPAARKFTDRIHPREAQAVQPKRSEGQPWAQMAQAEMQQDGPQVTR